MTPKYFSPNWYEIFCLECWAGTVGITVVGTLAVFRTLIPTSTFWNLIRGFTSLRVGGEHVSFTAAKFVGLLKLANHGKPFSIR